MRVLKLDYDKPTQLQLMRAYFYLKYIGCKKIYVFTTRKGWHIYAILPRDVSLDKELKIRRLLGDDEGRIEFDEAKEMLGLEDWEDTLFYAKYAATRRGIRKLHEEVPANPLYEPFYLKRTK